MGKKALQTRFAGSHFKPRLESGGILNKNSNAKQARPISTKKAMHIVLRSDVAKGSRDMRRFAKAIKKLIYKQADDCNISIYEMANVGNHIHLLIYLKSNSYYYAKECLSRFLRAISGLIARLVLNAQRGSAKSIQFWSYRPYTRVVEGFVKGYRIVKDYIVKNDLEARGIIPYHSRKKKSHTNKITPSRASPLCSA